ncbi:MAG: hypothetical protein P8Y62_08760 [candidate division WOR-3 bacterium]|jgi:hypothetical protein
MSIILLLSFNLFVSSSVPQGSASADTPSGFSLMMGGEHKINYDIIVSQYSRDNYDVNIYGILVGKELLLGQKLSILPEMGMVKAGRSREGSSDSGYFPLFVIRFAYLISTGSSTFQIGFSLREVFNEKIGTDFLDFGIGFRM